MSQKRMWAIVGLFTVAYWGSSTDPQYPLLLIDFLAGRFGVSWTLAAMPAVAASVCAVIGALSSGFLSRRLGAGTLIFVALWGFVGCSYLNTIDSTLGVFIATRGLTGLFQGSLSVLFLQAIGALVPERHRGLAVGILSAGAMLAVAAVPLLARATAPPGDHWHHPFWAFGAAALVAVIGLHAVRMPLFPEESEEKVSTWAMLRQPGMGGFLCLGGLILVSIVAMGSLFPVFAHEKFNLKLHQLVPQMITLGAGAVVGALIAGWLTDRLGARAILIWTSVAVTIFLVFVPPLSQTLWAVYPVFFIMSGLAAARVPPYQAVILTVLPEDARGPILGIRNTVSFLGTATGAGLGAFLYDRTGSYQSVAVFAAAFSLIALAVIMKIVPEHPKAMRPGEAKSLTD
jgi:predicted MFS family arabinose efflux permease